MAVLMEEHGPAGPDGNLAGRKVGLLSAVVLLVVPQLYGQTRYHAAAAPVGYLATSERDAAAGNQVQTADVDMDGDLDVIVGGVALLLNDGRGNLRDVSATHMPPPPPFDNIVWYVVVSTTAVGDLDGDGDPDLLSGRGGGYWLGPSENRLYLNDGTGHFSAVPVSNTILSSVKESTNALVIADFDGNGSLDVFSGNRSFDRLYLNQGGGSFALVPLPLTGRNTYAVAAGDVDGDGDVDVVLGKWTGWPRSTGVQNVLLLNDGRANFTVSSLLPLTKDPTTAVALADVDRDLDLDLIVANDYDFGTQQFFSNVLYLNDGTGRFLTPGNLPVDGDQTYSMAVGDVDGDGSDDIVFGNRGIPAVQDRLYLNDGSGTFIDATAISLPPAPSFLTLDLRLADLDRDGDADLLVTGLQLGNNDADLSLLGQLGKQTLLLTNATRQLYAPTPARIGGQLTLELHAISTTGVAALPWLSLGLLPSPVRVGALGWFHLDPATLTPGGAFVMPPGVQRLSVSYPIPPAPRLVGLSIFGQAGFLETSPQANGQLSNAVHAVILR